MARRVGSSHRKGIAAVEAALVFPLLLLLVLGLLEYGWLFLRAQQVTNAARHGARVAATADATNATVAQAVADLMASADLGNSGYTVSFSPADIAALGAGETLAITVSVSYANVGLGMPLVPVPAELDASISMAKEGP